MPGWLAFLGTIVLAGLAFLEGRTLVRSVKTGVPYLFFKPHPAYKNRLPNRNSPFLWFSVFGHVWGVMVFGLAAAICGAFFLGLG